MKPQSGSRAWSQNLGHEKVLTTFLSYGEVQSERQGEIVRELALPASQDLTSSEAIAEALFRRFRNAGFDPSLLR